MDTSPSDEILLMTLAPRSTMKVFSERSSLADIGMVRMPCPSRVDTTNPSLEIIRIDLFSESTMRRFPREFIERPRGPSKSASDPIPSLYHLSFGFPAMVVTSILSPLLLLHKKVN